MYCSAIILAGVVGLASAQSTTTLFLPGFDPQPILASVAGSDATATTYALACPASESPDKCGVPPSFTLIQGPATAHWTYSADGSYEQVDCSLGGTTTATCTITATPAESGSSVTFTGLSGSLLASQFQIVTLTDNLATATDSVQTSSSSGELSATIPGGQTLGGGTTILTGSSQSTTASQTSTPTSASIASTTSTSAASSATVTAATKASTAGIAQITGNAGWVAGGVVLALAVAGL